MNLEALTPTAQKAIAADLAESDREGRVTTSDRSERNPNHLSNSTHRIPSLDGLRGISIWAVMLAHAYAHFASTPLHIRRIQDFLWVMAFLGVTSSS